MLSQFHLAIISANLDHFGQGTIIVSLNFDKPLMGDVAFELTELEAPPKKVEIISIPNKSFSTLTEREFSIITRFPTSNSIFNLKATIHNRYDDATYSASAAVDFEFTVPPSSSMPLTEHASLTLFPFLPKSQGIESAPKTSTLISPDSVSLPKQEAPLPALPATEEHIPTSNPFDNLIGPTAIQEAPVAIPMQPKKLIDFDTKEEPQFTDELDNAENNKAAAILDVYQLEKTFALLKRTYRRIFAFIAVLLIGLIAIVCWQHSHFTKQINQLDDSLAALSSQSGQSKEQVLKLEELLETIDGIVKKHGNDILSSKFTTQAAAQDIAILAEAIDNLSKVQIAYFTYKFHAPEGYRPMDIKIPGEPMVLYFESKELQKVDNLPMVKDYKPTGKEDNDKQEYLVSITFSDLDPLPGADPYPDPLKTWITLHALYRTKGARQFSILPLPSTKNAANRKKSQ